MDAAVSLHHGALPAAAASSSLPPPSHHRRALHLRHPPPSSVSTRLATVTAARPSSGALARSRSSASASASPSAASAVPTRSTRAATGYAAALADASLRAGTLLGASRHAAALLEPRPPRGERPEPDPRVAALVRMLAGKGKAAMVAEVMAEFAAICDRLIPSSARANASSY